MQLFYLINGWAGRSVWLDEALRFFYVGAVPLLATLLAALLIFAPRHPGAASRLRVAWAAGLSTFLCFVTVLLVNIFSRNFLQAEILSPRPFITRRVNLLVIEPNDNSFPCVEVMIASALAVLLCAASPRWGFFGWMMAIFFGLARVICGSNYVADIGVGWIIGGALAGFSLALCRAPLHFGLSNGKRLVWQPKYQAAFSGLALVGVTMATIIALADTPRFSAKFKNLLTVPRATASTDNLGQERTSTTMSSHEGEGMVTQVYDPSSPANTSHDQHRFDFIPKAEQLLRTAWKPLHLAHHVLSVDVAQVRAGNTAYRTATVRFVVEKRGPEERRRVLQTATQLVRRSFHADGQLQNIDIVGIMRNPEQEDFAPRPATLPGPLPVFSASVAARDIRGNRSIPPKLAAANPGAGEPDAAWLRDRSLLYFNERVLPAASSARTVKK